MSGFLLDTCTISEARRPKPNAGLAQWLARVDPSSVYLSVLTLGEIRRGIEKLGDKRKKAEVEAWLSAALPAQFADRLLPIDDGVADRWGRLIANASASGVTLSPIDSLIAATALHYGLSVVTRNERHFAPAGVPVTNPWI